MANFQQALQQIRQTQPTQTAQPPKQGLLEEVGQRRGTEVLKSIQAGQRGEQSGFETLGQIGLQTLGGASDVIFGGISRGLSAVTPDVIEKPVVEGATRAISSVLGATPVPQAMQRLEADTRTTRNIKGLLSGVGFATDIAGAGLARKPAQAVAKKATTFGSQAAQKAVEPIASVAVKTPTKRIKQAQELYNRATDVAPSAKRRFEERTGRNVADTLLEEQLPLRTKKEASGVVLDTTDASRKINEELIPTYNDIISEILKDAPNKFNLESLRRRAKQSLSEMNEAAKVKVDVSKAVDDFIDAEIAEKGLEIAAKEYNDLKKNFWRFFEGDSIQKKAARELGFAIKKDIEDIFDVPIIRELNARQGALIELRSALARMNSKTVRGSGLGKKFNQLAGAVAGSQVPIVGPILGATIGGKVTEFLLNPERLTKAALDQLKKAGVIPASVKKLDEAREFIRKNREKIIQDLLAPQTRLLPAGPSPSQRPIQLPSPGILEGQAKVRSPNMQDLQRASQGGL